MVWIVPNAADTTCYSGLHFGRGKSAYQGLLAANLGRFEGLRFRRVRNLFQGQRIFVEEADSHQVSVSYGTRIFGWQ